MAIRNCTPSTHRWVHGNDLIDNIHKQNIVYMPLIITYTIYTHNNVIFDLQMKSGHNTSEVTSKHVIT